MSMKGSSAAISIAALAAVLAASNALAGEKPKIERAVAEKIALARAPGGYVKEAELEKEHGKLVWSFDISRPASPDITEVQVDAMTGEVVAVEKETPHDEAREAAREKKEKADK